MEFEMSEIDEICKRHEECNERLKALYEAVPVNSNLGTPAHKDRAILLDHIATLEAQLVAVAELPRYECRAVKFEHNWYAEEQPDDDGDYVRVGGIQAILAKSDK